MQNFGDAIQWEHFKNWGLTEGVGKNVHFQPKTGRISKTVRDRLRAKVANRES